MPHRQSHQVPLRSSEWRRLIKESGQKVLSDGFLDWGEAIGTVGNHSLKVKPFALERAGEASAGGLGASASSEGQALDAGGPGLDLLVELLFFQLPVHN